MDTWDKVKRLLLAFTTAVSLRANNPIQLPPNYQNNNEQAVDRATGLLDIYAGEKPPHQAVIQRFSNQLYQQESQAFVKVEKTYAAPGYSLDNIKVGAGSYLKNNPTGEYSCSEEEWKTLMDLYSPSDSKNLVINPFPVPDKQISYAEMHTQNHAILIERIWEIYDTYFDSQEIPESEFRFGREEFIVEIFGWFTEFTITSIAGGILGNFAYDKLKERIKRRQEKSSSNLKKYYRKLGQDVDLLLDVLEKTERDGKPVRAHEVSLATGISRESIRNWLKFFGFTHHGNCIWVPTARHV